MILNVPFYKNDSDGNQCLQVCLRTVLKYFLNKDYSLTELDKLTERKKDKMTWTTQAVSVLLDLGLKTKFYSKNDIKSFLGGEKSLIERYGKYEAEIMIKNSDVSAMIRSVKKLISKDCFEQRILTIAEIEKHIEQKHLVIALLDWTKIIDKDRFYLGHFVVLTGFDKENIYFHQSGPFNPEENMKVPKERFLAACNSNGTDNDMIVVSRN